MDSTATSEPLIRIRNLRFRYPGGSHDILRIPALDISGSGLTALCGPSGAGKSTLVELLAGTIREPYDGSIQVLGVEWKSLTRDADRQRHIRRIGLIPQDYGLLPGKTLWEILSQDLTDAGVSRLEQADRIKQALDEVKLGHFAHRESNRLSGGQRQRVAIARMLARSVDLVIADEPSANLDPELVEEILGLFRELSMRVPVLIVTHDTIVSQRCDRTVLLQSMTGEDMFTASPSTSGPNPSRRRNVAAMAAVATLLLLGLGGGGAAALMLHQTTKTPTAVTRPSPVIASRALINTVATGSVIKSAVKASNDSWMASVHCSCDNGLEKVKTGGELARVLQQVHDLQSNGTRWEVVLHSWHAAQPILESPISSAVSVTKNETREAFQGNLILQVCDGPYDVNYHLTKIGGTWKVDTANVVNNQQSCKDIPSGAPTPSASTPMLPAPAPSQSSAASDVVTAAEKFSIALKYAAHTSDCSAMTTVATGDALSKENDVCTSDAATSVHKDINDLSTPIIQGTNVSPDGTAASVTVVKHQDILFIHDSCGLPDDQNLCGGSGPAKSQRDQTYTVTYHLVNSGGTWLVSSFEVQ